MSTKYVLLYESADDVVTKVPLHFAAHQARGQEFHNRGLLLMYGPFGNPQQQGSMSIFTSRKSAEDFANGDPFVVNGLVRRWEIREWKEALVP